MSTYRFLFITYINHQNNHIPYLAGFSVVQLGEDVKSMHSHKIKPISLRVTFL